MFLRTVHQKEEDKRLEVTVHRIIIVYSDNVRTNIDLLFLSEVVVF